MIEKGYVKGGGNHLRISSGLHNVDTRQSMKSCRLVAVILAIVLGLFLSVLRAAVLRPVVCIKRQLNMEINPRPDEFVRNPLYATPRVTCDLAYSDTEHSEKVHQVPPPSPEVCRILSHRAGLSRFVFKNISRGVSLAVHTLSCARFAC